MAALAVLGVHTALAQASPRVSRRAPPTTGLAVGLGATAVGVRLVQHQPLDLDQTNYGGGVGVAAAWGLTRAVGVLARVAGARFTTSRGERYTFRIVDLGGRVSLARPGGVVVPFVEGAFTRRTVWLHDVRVSYAGLVARGDATARGDGGTAGVGVQYHVRAAWSLEGAALLTWGRLDDVTIAGVDLGVRALGLSANSARLIAGVSWRPGR